MYKITVLFKSNIAGIYSQDIETVLIDDYCFIRKKIMRMIHRWMDILISPEEFKSRYAHIFKNYEYSTFKHIDYFDPLDENLKKVDLVEANLKIHIIKQHIELLNDFDKGKLDSFPRSWDITIETI
jgi:hypothetical protein